jgi:hypothetical protein
MAKDYGPNVSGFLDPDLRAYETTVYQASKPVLDKELNLVQDLAQASNRAVRTGVPSGWLSPGVVDSSDATGDIYTASSVANEYEFPALSALVNDWQVLVRYTNSSTDSNKIDLGAGPSGVGAKRTDLVFLEVWRKLVSASPDTDGKSPSGRIWRNGNVKIAPADDLTLNPADEILDVAVGSETTKRVQIQYRVRVFQGVNLDSYPQAIDDPTVFAHTVPPDALTPDGVATAFNYANQSAAGDGGLYVAGDGNPANGLGTVDGYMYAIPLVAVFRRNVEAFDRDNNMNGGVATPGPSDRPDGLFHDIVAARDLMDLRFTISQTGWDYQELLSKNVNFLFDNQLRTEQYTSGQGGGSVGHTTIWADEIGSIDNPGPELIRDFDAVSRSFTDRPTLETVWLKYSPADQNGGGPNWTSGDFVSIDPTNLPIHPYANSNLASVAPSNISIVDVLNAVFVWDGVSATVRGNVVCGPLDDREGTGYYADYSFLARSVTGLGTVPVGPVTFVIGAHMPGVPDMDMYVQVVVAYPGGNGGNMSGGLTKTPTGEFGTASFVNETPAQLPAASPYYYDTMSVQAFDAPHREVNLTYQTLSQTFSQGFWDQDLSADGSFPSTIRVLFVPDRVDSVSSITNVDTGETYQGTVTISDDGHWVFVTNDVADWSGGTPASQDDTIDIEYVGVRPIPDNNIQYTLWYEVRAPQTTRDALLGTTLTVIPRFTSPHLYCLVSGSSSLDEAYPFPQQYVQSPGVYPSSGGTFDGDHELDGTGTISVSNFDAASGFIQVPTLIPAVPEPQNLVLLRDLGDIDAEGRSFFKEVPAGYIPSAFGQPLSDPKKHKNCLPLICELAEDGPIGPKGTLLLVMFARWAEFDPENAVSFDTDLAQNFTSASVYRLKGNPLNNRRI